MYNLQTYKFLPLIENMSQYVIQQLSYKNRMNFFPEFSYYNIEGIFPRL